MTQSLSHLFPQDTELPIAVPPIGTVFDTFDLLKQQYPVFTKFLMNLPENEASKYVSFGIVIAHPPHSVVVPFVEPVEAETETHESKESEEPIVKQPIITTMQKILRPEIGQIITTPEEVEKFKVFLLMHIGNSGYIVTANDCPLWHLYVQNKCHLPFTVHGVNPDYDDIFITEAELAQAEAEAETVIPVSEENGESHLLPTAENIRDYAIDLESNFSKSLSVIKQNINDLFERLGESKPF